MAGAWRSPLEGIASFLDVHVITSPLNVVVRAHFLFPRVFGVFLELRIKSVCVCVCVCVCEPGRGCTGPVAPAA